MADKLPEILGFTLERAKNVLDGKNLKYTIVNTVAPVKRDFIKPSEKHVLRVIMKENGIIELIVG
jgi:hypothetical protein